jgi:hypothetical protein
VVAEGEKVGSIFEEDPRGKKEISEA